MQCPELPLQPRGLIPIKGKGEMSVYWVNETHCVSLQKGVKGTTLELATMEPLVEGSERSEGPVFHPTDIEAQ